MNHSSILQIHLNGWRKFIVRWRAFDKDLFSCRCLFFSLSFPSFVREGASDQKAESRFKATGAPPERRPQSASELESYLGFFIYLWAGGKKRADSMKFQGICELGSGCEKSRWGGDASNGVRVYGGDNAKQLLELFGITASPWELSFPPFDFRRGGRQICLWNQSEEKKNVCIDIVSPLLQLKVTVWHV